MDILSKNSDSLCDKACKEPSSNHQANIAPPSFLPYLLILTPLSLFMALAYIMEISTWPGMTVNVAEGLDMARYVDNANKLLEGIWPGTALFYRAPLYSYILAFLFWLGFGHIGVSVVQGVLFAITVLITARMALLEFGRMAGWVAGFLLLLYGGAAYWVAILHSTTIELFFGIYLLLSNDKIPSKTQCGFSYINRVGRRSPLPGSSQLFCNHTIGINHTIL